MGPRYASYFVVAFSCFGGLGASYNVLFMKSLVVMLGDIQEAFSQYFAYVIVVLLICANSWLEYWKQRSLGLFGALYVVPIFQVMLIVGGILVGAVYFEEFSGLGTTQVVCFVISICLCLVGVAVLAASSAVQEEQLFDRMRSKMASHARFLQTIEILKDYIQDKLQDLDEDFETQRHRRETRLEAFTSTNASTTGVSSDGKLMVAKTPKARSMFMQKLPASTPKLGQTLSTSRRSFIAGPSAIGGSFAMWRNMRAMTANPNELDLMTESNTQRNVVSTNL